MAKNYADLSEEEYKEKVLWLADYIIRERASTRKAEKYAKENNFLISHVAIYNMMQNKLSKYDLEKYEKVMEVLNANKEKTIESEEVCERVKKAVLLLLQEDLTLPEIAEKLHSTPDIIYDDLVKRLQKLNEVDAKKVKERLEKHRLENLDPQKKKNSIKKLDSKNVPGGGGRFRTRINQKRKYSKTKSKVRY